MQRLDNRVRFARVPTGATTCPYCLMLASRGFVYRSELKALNANHRYCDCRIVEGFDGMQVEGYDPDEYYDRWKHPEKYAANDASERSRTDENAFEWRNERVKALEDAQEVEQYLAQQHGIEVSDEFKQLDINVQKGVAAGIDDAIGVYGKAAIDRVDVRQSRAIDGWYNPDTGVIYVNPAPSDAYLTGFHETIHGIDAQKSAPLPLPKSVPADKMYNIFSYQVKEEASKRFGFSFESDAYFDELAWFYGIDAKMKKEYQKPEEAMAYLAEKVAAGRSTEFAKTVTLVMTELL